MKYKNITLFRLNPTPNGVYGIITPSSRAHAPLTWTLERQNVDNRKEVDCIPEGVYKCRRYSSEKYPFAYEVLDVPGRSHILIHTGNTISNTKGCILVGKSVGYYGEKEGVWASGDAMKYLRKHVADEFTLTIKEI